MTIVDLLILSAATWYASYVVTSSDGPFRVFTTIRKALPLGGLTACIVCLAFWVAQGLALATGHTFIDGLAIAGVALWIHRYTGWAYSHSQ